MKKHILLYLILLISGLDAFAQTMLIMARPAGSKLWGYANIKGDLVIPARFENCHPFTADGLAAIYDTKERQHYFIDTKGDKLVTEVTSYKLKDGMLTDLESFSEGMVQIKVGEKWGYMNKSGKIGIPAKYEETSTFNNGYAIAKTGGNYVVINTRGDETIIVGTGILEVKDFSEYLAIFKSADRKYGFIGIDGKIAVPALFESVGYFKNGLAWAKTPEKLLGYIDTKGNWVIQPQFEAGKDFDAESGMARVKKGSKWLYVNKTGQTTEISISESYGDFSEGLAEGKIKDKKGFYNNKAAWVIEPKFDGTRDFKHGYAAAKQGDKWGLIDTKGNWVIQPAFEAIRDVEVVK